MIIRLAFVPLINLCLASLATEVQLKGEPFHPGDIPIASEATNSVKNLWIYKTIPQTFSRAVISNAMAFGHFKSLDIVKTKDKNILRFEDHKQAERVTRYLEILPAAGWMQYNDSAQPTDIVASTQGVPDAQEAERLALEVLFKLGIDRTQLTSSPRPTGSMGISKLAPDGKEQFIGLQAMHVGLIRQIDGIRFSGNGMTGGLWIEFGNNAKIKQFELTWRNLVPYEVQKVMSAAQILSFVKQGRAVLSSEIDFKAATRFTMTSITPEYRGNLGTEPQDLIYPIASLEMKAETKTGSLSFTLACPILEEAESPARK